MMNLVIWLCGAGCYTALVLAGFSRGVAFATGLVVAIGGGFFLQAWTARLARKQTPAPPAAAASVAPPPAGTQGRQNSGAP